MYTGARTAWKIDNPMKDEANKAAGPPKGETGPRRGGKAPVEPEPAPEKPWYCNARCKQSDGRCRKPKAAGRTRCRLHGGAALVGSAAGGFKTGMFSKHVPNALRSTFDQLAADPDLLSLREDVAILGTRLSKLLERLDDGESAELWTELREAMAGASARHAELGAAVRGGNAAEFEVAFRALSERLAEVNGLIRRATSREDTWREVQDVIEQRTRTAKREWDRLVDLNAVLTAEQAGALVMAISHSVRRHVKDPTALASIAADISILTSSQKDRRAARPEETPPPPPRLGRSGSNGANGANGH